MNPESTTALFRAHATARLRGDTVEAARLAARIEPGQRLTHVLFLIALLTQAVIEEYGAQPDPTDLAAITKRLHDKHFATNPSFNALRAEAMVRGICGDSLLLTEIPHSEQPAYLWAVIGELVEPDLTDAELTELFDQAEETGLACLTEAFEETIRNHPKRVGKHGPPTPEPSAAHPAEGSAADAAAGTDAIDTAESPVDAGAGAASFTNSFAAEPSGTQPSEAHPTPSVGPVPAAPSEEDPA